jgi:hypothetical protein
MPGPAATGIDDEMEAVGAGMRDWRGIKAMIGDRVFYVTIDGTHKPEIHEAWVEEADESHILVRSTASAFGDASGNSLESHRLKQPEDFVVAKGQGFI